MNENATPGGRPDCTFEFDEVFGGDVEIEVFPDAIAAVLSRANSTSEPESCEKLIEFEDDGSRDSAA